MMKVYKKALLPIGFKANGLNCGIRKSKKLDLALIYSQIPAKAACFFTTNKIKAAPVQLDIIHLKKGRSLIQAIIANSGNANCFTGKAGFKDAESIAAVLAKHLKVKKEHLLVASTGVIGKRLPAGKIKVTIPNLARGLSSAGIDKAKSAIMTTDTFAKEISVKFTLSGKVITICGIAKGAGMIAPDMATMLCFIMTDANISQVILKKALKEAVDNSFNCVTVDGCMSTNDTVAILANAAVGNPLITGGQKLALFSRALNLVCLELAKMMVKDGEGASKFIKIMVEGAKNASQAKKAALAIANSNLFKTAMYGENPNFGRIVAAVGASGAEVKEESFKVKVSPLQKRDIDICVDLNRGGASATVYTSDLTPQYIKINAEYN
ncbi:MAG TPA: bifunctional glutamate N-acetyltransferase/amino-acid acetyltransferase ArgJ [Candidatus Margulisiibacteriota bacterium]|nr:bifunctional glutamate N-acetyltransferase/amino-acid acetyltransferase ArgJ [Candidatus Margulisiibacteriota bacterium]